MQLLSFNHLRLNHDTETEENDTLLKQEQRSERGDLQLDLANTQVVRIECQYHINPSKTLIFADTQN